MAQRGLNMGLALVLMAAMWACSSAQPTCQPPIVSLQPCLGFITNNSSSAPSPQCCSQLAGMVQSQVQCMCTFLNSAPPLPFNINRTQAITLPGACNIQAAPLSQCNVQSGPLTPAAPAGPLVPAAPTGPVVPGASTGPFVPTAGAPTSPVTPSAASAPEPASPVAPTAPSGVPPPSNPSPAAKGVPPAPGGSKAGPNKGQASASGASFNVFTPSLLFSLMMASVLSSF